MLPVTWLNTKSRPACMQFHAGYLESQSAFRSIVCQLVLKVNQHVLQSLWIHASFVDRKAMQDSLDWVDRKAMQDSMQDTWKVNQLWVQGLSTCVQSQSTMDSVDRKAMQDFMQDRRSINLRSNDYQLMHG